MKKERKLKLVMNKMKISKLNKLHGGTGVNTTVASVVLCATDDPQTAFLVCPISGYDTCPEPTSATGATRTINSIKNCLVMSDSC